MCLYYSPVTRAAVVFTVSDVHSTIKLWIKHHESLVRFGVLVSIMFDTFILIQLQFKLKI